MITEVDRDAREFRKRAETAADAARLEHEARVLAVARHPGVVELVGHAGTTLRLRLVDGVAPGDLTSHAVVVATTLADLHDLGVAHGAIGADHVIFDRSGAPVLCSFGRGHTGVAADGPEAVADVRALGAALLAGSDDPRQRRVLTHAARTDVAARRLAQLLASPSSPRRSNALALTLAALVVLASAAALVVSTGRHRSDRACPALDEGCQPLGATEGVVEVPAGHFRIGRPGDVVVLGRWQCHAALPALLQPATGRVWVFDSWPAGGASQPGRLVAQVPAAVSLRVDPDASGCDRLQVTRRGGAAVVVHPRALP